MTVGATLALKYGDKATDARTTLEILSPKVGLVLIVLGEIHYFFVHCHMKAERGDQA